MVNILVNNIVNVDLWFVVINIVIGCRRRIEFDCKIFFKLIIL